MTHEITISDAMRGRNAGTDPTGASWTLVLAGLGLPYRNIIIVPWGGMYGAKTPSVVQRM
jgi:glutathione S-transferase